MVNRYELRALAADGTEGPLLATLNRRIHPICGHPDRSIPPRMTHPGT